VNSERQFILKEDNMKKSFKIGFILILVMLLSFGGLLSVLAVGDTTYLFKIEADAKPDEAGPFGPGTFNYQVNSETTFSVTISDLVIKDEDGKVEYTGFSWSSNFPVYEVLVKASNDPKVYPYPEGALSGTGLLSVFNSSNNKYHGISHVVFKFKIPQTQPKGTVTVTKTFLPVDETHVKNGIAFELHQAELFKFSASTNNDGIAVFENIPAGTYQLVELTPLGYTTSLNSTNNTVVVVAGDNSPVSVTNTKMSPLTNRSLNLTALCINEDMAGTKTRWRITNDSGADVQYKYEVYGSNPKIEGYGTIDKKHTSAERFNDPYSILIDAPHPATVKLYWGDDWKFSVTKASSPDVCTSITITKYVYAATQQQFVIQILNDKGSVVDTVFLGNGQSATRQGFVIGRSFTIKEIVPTGFKLKKIEIPEILTGGNEFSFTLTGATNVYVYNEIDGEDPGPGPFIISSFEPSPSISITKSVLPTQVVPGQNVVFSFTVTNTGNVPLDNVVVTDSMLNLEYVYDQTLFVGGSFSFIQGYTVPVDEEAGPVTNTAFVTGSYGVTSFTASATAVFDVLMVVVTEIPQGEIILDTPVPAGPVPDAGEASAMIFYGLGALVTAAGFGLRKRF
jgi:uncharacterized repeat protein (TIGR01451 family)